MSFEKIIQLFDLLEEILETVHDRPAIEQEIIKKRICDLYLQMIDTRKNSDTSTFISMVQEKASEIKSESFIDNQKKSNSDFIAETQLVEPTKVCNEPQLINSQKFEEPFQTIEYQQPEQPPVNNSQPVKEERYFEPAQTFESANPEANSQFSNPQETSKAKREMDYRNLTDILLNKSPNIKPDVKEDNTVLGRFSNAKITDLKRAIAMNERFIFIKELFKNDFEAYNQSINDLNIAADMAEAFNRLNQLKSQYGWDDDNEVVCRFISLIERKFI
ncbi:MAG: hypothetical protein LBH92_00645 [Bacteroidales bacterium]|jgi:hypothetical protein|nr:hypothetical protein [Bacteroidales bacterium]